MLSIIIVNHEPSSWKCDKDPIETGSDCPIFSFFQGSRPFLPFGQDSQEKIGRFLETFFPDLPISLCGFEFPLKEGLDWGDFHFAFQPFSKSFYALLHSQTLNSPLWRKVKELFQQWDQERNSIERSIQKLIFEFDIGSCADWPPQPNLFLCFDSRSPFPLSLIERVFFHFHEKPLPEAFHFLLSACKQKDLSPRTIGFMLARSGSIRFTIRSPSLSLEELAQLFFLEEPDHILHSINKTNRNELILLKPPFMYGINITETGTISSKLGFRGLKKIKTSHHLNHFEKMNWIGLDKKKALFNWEGSSQESGKIYMRTLNHFKYVCAPGERLSIKGYLAVRSFA